MQIWTVKRVSVSQVPCCSAFAKHHDARVNGCSLWRGDWMGLMKSSKWTVWTGWHSVSTTFGGKKRICLIWNYKRIWWLQGFPGKERTEEHNFWLMGKFGIKIPFSITNIPKRFLLNVLTFIFQLNQSQVFLLPLADSVHICNFTHLVNGSFVLMVDLGAVCACDFGLPDETVTEIRGVDLEKMGDLDCTAKTLIFGPLDLEA